MSPAPPKELTFDDILGLPHLLVVYAATKFGKTTDMLETFQRGVHLLTNLDGAKSFASKARANPELGLKLPKIVPLPEFNAQGHLLDMETTIKQFIVGIGQRVKAEKAKGLPSPVSAVIIDEMSTVMQRITAYKEATGVKGWDKWTEQHEFIQWFVKIAREICPVDLVFVHHEFAPMFNGDGDEVENKGRCIKIGGPLMPTQKLMEALCREATAVIRGYLVESRDPMVKPQRVYSTQPAPFWRAGVRDGGLLDAREPLGFKALLAKSGLRTGDL